MYLYVFFFGVWVLCFVFCVKIVQVFFLCTLCLMHCALCISLNALGFFWRFFFVLMYVVFCICCHFICLLSSFVFFSYVCFVLFCRR